MDERHDDWLIRLPWAMDRARAEELLTHEWLVTNGLGGYASGTIAGVATRRYHSLLIAALPAPLGRHVMLNHLSEKVRLPSGRTLIFGAEERPDVLELHGADHLMEFRLERGLPVWRYEIDGTVIEKQIMLPYRQNTVHIRYRLVEGDGLTRIKLRPSVHFRPHEAPVSIGHAGVYELTGAESRYELAARGSELPPLRMYLYGERHAITLEGQSLPETLYRVEQSRGYESRGTLWSPGYFRADLGPDRPVTLVISTESWETILALRPEEALAAEWKRRDQLLNMAAPSVRSGLGRELVTAADQFLVTPAARLEDAARARAAGDEARTVIAGYHWFTDWGRDTMISLEGLTLVTGRHVEAGYILRTFAQHVRDGLIPNLFPEGAKGGLYHTADASLWFFHSLDRYLASTGDRATLKLLMPKLIDIVDHHLRGTHFGIGVDPADGLLRQGAEGYQLTWMDAKVGDWVVTPRRGKAVEINALWYNALRLLEQWLRDPDVQDALHPAKDDSILMPEQLRQHAERARASFNERFWFEKGGYLYDVVDGEGGNDPSCRPNQVLAVSLPHAILEKRHWTAVLNVVTDRLLTPVGLRSLAPGHPDYKAKYFGDLRARDAAYHQGTVWAWLIGPFIDAWLKVHPGQEAEARRFLHAFEDHLGQACFGSISEVFDADAPFTPRGCIAQAWSVAEVLRCWAKTAPQTTAAAT